MKHRLIDAIRSAASFITLLWGTIFGVAVLVLLYLAWAGTVPYWHSAVMLMVSLATLTASYLLS